MEGKVCLYHNLGYCKFQEKCKDFHLEQICHDLSACRNQKSCQKRHPRGCKKYVLEGFCRFKTECAYHHQEHTTKNHNREMNMKVENLEKIVKEMTERIGQLEDKIKDIKSKEKEEEKVKEVTKAVERKDLNKDENKKNPKAKKSKIEDRKIQFSFLETRLAVQPQVKSMIWKKKQKKYFKCDFCDYRCEKLSIMKKHIQSSHIEQKCNMCKKEFITSIEFVNHKAKDH